MKLVPILGPQKDVKIQHRIEFRKCLNVFFSRTTMLQNLWNIVQRSSVCSEFVISWLLDNYLVPGGVQLLTYKCMFKDIYIKKLYRFPWSIGQPWWLKKCFKITLLVLLNCWLPGQYWFPSLCWHFYIIQINIETVWIQFVRLLCNHLKIMY